MKTLHFELLSIHTMDKNISVHCELSTAVFYHRTEKYWSIFITEHEYQDRIMKEKCMNNENNSIPESEDSN